MFHKIILLLFIFNILNAKDTAYININSNATIQQSIWMVN